MDNDCPIDLEYIFVIDKNAAVTKMIVELGDNKVYGIVKEYNKEKQWHIVNKMNNIQKLRN
jgi:hypothetical protein